MKALLCREPGPVEALEMGETEAPRPGPGELGIAVHACGINFADLLMVQGRYQERPPPPFSPGMEVSGTVLALGEGVSGFSPGDRVVALCGSGGLAEEVVAPAASSLHLEGGMDFTSAAAFNVAYGTAHLGLAHRARLAAGEVLLVHGAAGGVGLAALEIGKLMGATVIATAGSEAKLRIAAEHGADHVINYREGGFRERVKALCGGRGADVVFDPVGGAVFDESLRCINWEGRLLVVGFASGTIPKAPANLLLVKNCSVVGLYWGAYQRHAPEVLKASWRTLFGWYEAGRLRPCVSATYPLERGVEALQALAGRRAVGRVVVEVRSPASPPRSAA